MADWRDNIDYNWGLAKKPTSFIDSIKKQNTPSYSQLVKPTYNPYTGQMEEEVLDGFSIDTAKLFDRSQGDTWYKGLGNTLGTGYDAIGGAKGFSDLAGGAASLYGMYNDYQQNKRAEEAFGLQKAEYNRGVQKDKDFAASIGKSGLGTYSAGA